MTKSALGKVTAKTFENIRYVILKTKIKSRSRTQMATFWWNRLRKQLFPFYVWIWSKKTDVKWSIYGLVFLGVFLARDYKALSYLKRRNDGENTQKRP